MCAHEAAEDKRLLTSSTNVTNQPSAVLKAPSDVRDDDHTDDEAVIWS